MMMSLLLQRLLVVVLVVFTQHGISLLNTVAEAKTTTHSLRAFSVVANNHESHDHEDIVKKSSEQVFYTQNNGTTTVSLSPTHDKEEEFGVDHPTVTVKYATASEILAASSSPKTVTKFERRRYDDMEEDDSTTNVVHVMLPPSKKQTTKQENTDTVPNIHNKDIVETPKQNVGCDTITTSTREDSTNTTLVPSFNTVIKEEIQRRKLAEDRWFPEDDKCENSPGIYDTCDESRFPKCPENTKICFFRKPRRDSYWRDKHPKFYIDYSTIQCIPEEQNCSICHPGRFCERQGRCILDERHFNCWNDKA